MSKQKDPAIEATKVLHQINANLEREGNALRMVGVNFIKRGDYTLAVIHAQSFDPIKPLLLIGYGMSKRHPEDESDRAVGYDYSFKRAIEDVMEQYRKSKRRAVTVSEWV